MHVTFPEQFQRSSPQPTPEPSLGSSPEQFPESSPESLPQSSLKNRIRALNVDTKDDSDEPPKKKL